MAAAARAFSVQTGIKVDVSACEATWHHGRCDGDGDGECGLLREVRRQPFDLAIAGSEADLDDLERTEACVSSTRRSLGLREIAILVPRGNPAGVERLEHLTRPGVRVGISTLDCLRGAWEDACARAGCLFELLPNIAVRAPGCMNLEGMIIRGELDAAFGWATSADAHSRIDSVPLPDAARTLRSTGAVVLKGGIDPEGASRFADYLGSPDGWARFAAAGWSVPPLTAR